jgi:hypothetical protein
MELRINTIICCVLFGGKGGERERGEDKEETQNPFFFFPTPIIQAEIKERSI